MLNSKTAFGHFPDVFKKPGAVFFLFTICFVYWQIDLWRPFNAQQNGTNFVWDMYGYYSYLPAIILNHGDFHFDESVRNFISEGLSGELFPKYTCGVAILQLPFFLIGVIISFLSGDVGNGFGINYVLSVEFGGIFYAVFGLFLVRKVLLQYYNDFVVTLTLFICLFGTLVFTYGIVQTEMSHIYLFFLFCVFIYCTQQFFKSHRMVYFVGLSFAGGLAVMMRAVEIYIYVFFFFWEVKTIRDFADRLKFFFSNWKLPAIMIVALLISWSPQLIFWKLYAHQFYYDAYLNEHFFWNDPQIWNILFSYRKGWITYTPAVVLSFIGFFMVGRKSPYSGFTFFGVTIYSVYVFSCWWTWDYGGCFGARAFSQQMAFLSFPMAALIDKVTSSENYFLLKRSAALLVLVAAFSCVGLSIGQNYQYQMQRKIHPNQMSKELYFDLFRTYQYHHFFSDYIYWKELNTDPTWDWRKGVNRDDKTE